MDEIEQLTEPVAAHGECPVWSADWGGLRWVDISAGDVLELSASAALSGSDGVRRWHVGEVVGAIRPRTGGGMVLALRRGFALAGPWGSTVEAGPDLWHEPDLRFNDGGCDPDGNFWCASMPEDFGPGRGVMYRLAPEGSVTAQWSGIGVSNGLDWTPDGSGAYHADTLARTIDRYDYDGEHGLHGRRPFVRITDGDGMPDGLAVDSEGYVWVALWNGGAVHRYAPDGRLDAVLRFPVRHVSACTFGGTDLNELFVTTMATGCEPREVGAAGAVFRVRTGVSGQPVRPFAG